MTATMPTPLLYTIDPSPIDVRDGWWRRHECTIDEHGIVWNGRRLAYQDITAVGYRCTTRVYNLVQRRVDRRILLGFDRTASEIRLGEAAFGPNNVASQRDTYRMILATLHELVEPRLRAQLLRALATDSIVEIGPLRLSSNHLEHRASGTRVQWRQLPSAQLDGETVVVTAAIEHIGTPLARIDALTANAPLLPELLDEAAITFS